MSEKVDRARQGLCRDFIGLSPDRRARVVLDAQKLAEKQQGAQFTPTAAPRAMTQAVVVR